MTKQEAIEVLNELAERLKHVPDSYDSETDVRAIEIGIECIKKSIALDVICSTYQIPELVLLNMNKKGE